MRQHRRPCGANTMPITLLDYGCGFGGDVQKWAHAGIHHAVAVDPCADAIERARRRVLDADVTVSPRYCFLHESDPMSFLVSLPPDCLDLITCNFAVHFYDREGQCKLLQQAWRVLSHERGAFVLTYMDAQRVMAYRNDGVAGDLLRITMLSPTRIRVSLRDSVFFDSVGGSTEENLTFTKFLRMEAEKIGFAEVVETPFEAFLTRGNAPAETAAMTEAERAVSALHVALVLRKRQLTE